MKYLAIDIGTYSIKTVLLKMERKTYTILSANEYVIEELLKDIQIEKNDETSESQMVTLAQREIVSQLVPKDFDGKIIWQIPNSFVISRHLELPVIQQKKIDMMVPFQLDENLPFSSNEAHFFYQTEKKGKSSQILVNITKKSNFLEYYNFYKDYELLPMVLTSELSVIHSYAQNKQIKGPVAILDIGHKTSKCYIIYNGRVIDHHFSYCAGGSINEVIAETYNIPRGDAAAYKHENCFFLTESQYDEVSEDQKAFALLMKKTMMPLALEVKRWLLGFRVKYGINVETLYLTGGTSNIHNIGNFLAQNVNIKTEFLDVGQNLVDEMDAVANQESNYFISILMGLGLTSKEKPGNFLTGIYATNSNLSLPLHSAGMIFYRSTVLLIVFTLLFSVEHYFLSKQERVLDQKIKSYAGRSALKINKKVVSGISRGTDRIESVIRNKKDAFIQDVSLLQSGMQINALPPFFSVFQLIEADPSITLKSIKTDGEFTQGEFLITNPQKLKDVEEKLRQAPLNNLSIKSKANVITFQFEK